MNPSMRKVLGKPLHMETDDRICTSLVYKEIRLNDGVESNKIYLSSPLLDSELSEYTMSTDQKMPEDSTGSVGKMREKFYEFVAAAKKLNVDAHFNQLKKNLNFKMTRVLAPDELVSYFERIYTKVQANPRQARKNWNEEETFLLVSLVAYYCLMKDEDYNCLSEEVWDYLSLIYPGKKADKLKQRWHGIFKVTLSKIPWTPAEDQLLVKLVQEKNAQKPWKDVAMELYSKSGLGIYRQGRQCRERWVNHLDPSINRGYWTTEEDINLLKSYLEIGRKWSELAKKMKNRTENTVKNRWKSLMKKFKSIVCPENLVNLPTQEPEREEKLEQLIAQAVLNCYEKGILTKIPTKQDVSKERENTNRNPPVLTRNQSSPQMSLEEGLRTKINASDMVIVEDRNPFEQTLTLRPRKKVNNTQLMETDADNLSKNLLSGELIDRPVRPAWHAVSSVEAKKGYPQPYSSRLGEGFSSVNNSYIDSNSSCTFGNNGLNNSFDYAYLAGGRLQTNSESLFHSLQSKMPTYGRSQDDFFLSKKGMEEENPIAQEYGLRNPIIPRDGVQTPPQKLFNEGISTPIHMTKAHSLPFEEVHPDLFINYENENKSDSMNIDTFDFFSSEIESNSEFSLFGRTNNLNDLIFNSKWDSRARAKSERDPTEQLSTEGGYGNPFKSEIVRNNNRGVRKSSLDLLLESSTTIEGQDVEEKEMSLHLKRFSEFKQEEYFNKQSGNSMFFALVDTSKNELFLIDSVTKDNYGPAINTIKLKKPAHKPSVFEGLDLARHFPNDNMKNLKHQLSNFNLS